MRVSNNVPGEIGQALRDLLELEGTLDASSRFNKIAKIGELVLEKEADTDVARMDTTRLLPLIDSAKKRFTQIRLRQLEAMLTNTFNNIPPKFCVTDYKYIKADREEYESINFSFQFNGKEKFEVSASNSSINDNCTNYIHYLNLNESEFETDKTDYRVIKFESIHLEVEEHLDYYEAFFPNDWTQEDILDFFSELLKKCPPKNPIEIMC